MILGPVRMMGVGMVLMLCVEEVCTLPINICCLHKHLFHMYRLVSCPDLINPTNGVISCSLGDDGVPSYEDTCSFTCNAGYELTGSDTRTCQSNRSWSGSDDVCGRGKLMDK